MRRLQPRFTRIELLIVVSVLAFFSECEMRMVFGSQAAAHALADSANLRWHAQQLELYRLQNRRSLPSEGGHKFVLSTWRIVGRTAENFDRSFTPGRRDDDPDYRRLRSTVERGEKIWEDLKSTTSLDTHYAGRAKEHRLSLRSGDGRAGARVETDLHAPPVLRNGATVDTSVGGGLPGPVIPGSGKGPTGQMLAVLDDEALMADDNEGRWSHADGTVNVLFHGGVVRTYGFLDLKNRGYVQGELDKSKPIETTGPDSPIPECRKLAR